MVKVTEKDTLGLYMMHVMKAVINYMSQSFATYFTYTIFIFKMKLVSYLKSVLKLKTSYFSADQKIAWNFWNIVNFKIIENDIWKNIK